MTALSIQAQAAPVQLPQPSLRRLLGAAIVAGIGAIVFSVAFAAFVAVNRSDLPASAAADAQALAGWIPAILAIGSLHLVVAVALVRGRDLVRMIAAAVTGLVALAAATAAVMVAASVDPFGWSAVDHPTGSGVGILALTAALYGVAALAAGSGPAED
jgi:hypothetical protein